MRSLTGMWWVRTSVSEESLCAPSLTLVLATEWCGGRKRSRGGFSCHFKTNEWSPSWGLGQHRAWCKREDFWAGALVPKCPSSSLQVSFHHGVNLKHSDVRRKEKKNPRLQNKLWPVPPGLLYCFCPVYNSFISKHSCVWISARISSPLSPLCLSLLIPGSE